MQEETPHARASLLAAADEGVRRHARGGRAPQFLKRIIKFQYAKLGGGKSAPAGEGGNYEYE